MKQLSGTDNLFLRMERGHQFMHVAGLGIYDPSTAPKFAWPERLTQVRSEIKQQAQARSDAVAKGPPAAPKAPAR